MDSAHLYMHSSQVRLDFSPKLIVGEVFVEIVVVSLEETVGKDFRAFHPALLLVVPVAHLTRLGAELFLARVPDAVYGLDCRLAVFVAHVLPRMLVDAYGGLVASVLDAVDGVLHPIRDAVAPLACYLYVQLRRRRSHCGER